LEANESTRSTSRVEPFRVLIVVSDAGEAEPLLAELASEFDTLVVTSGEDALRIAGSKEPPDLMLVDVILGEMDGFEVCRKLKANKDTEDTPIILMAVDREVGARGLELGAADYITKPFILPAVRARVRTHLTLKRQVTMLSEMFFIDPVTGLPNHRRFEEVLNREWRRGRRENTPLSLILMGIDFCEAFYECGDKIERDRCIKAIAKTLNASLRRATDFLARYSDEHFAAILSATDYRGATNAAEMMREKIIREQIQVSYENITDRITLSFGTASIIPRSDSSHHILKRAAMRMLKEATDRGRNRVESLNFDPPVVNWYP
jgi:diguanylate cyclase (GGDEF)-like protein